VQDGPAVFKAEGIGEQAETSTEQPHGAPRLRATAGESSPNAG
jgi:hypothetical protein